VRRRARAAGLTLLVALLLALIATAAWVMWALNRPYAGWPGSSVDVVLDSGMDAGSMLARLHQAGVLRHPRLLRTLVAWRGEPERLHAGEYRFDHPLSALDVWERLRSGDVLLHAITIPEGLILEQVAARIAEAGLGTLDELVAAFRDPSPIRDWDAAAHDLEGYLFPETYRFPRSADAPSIARAMVRRFKEAAGHELAERAARVGLDLRQAVTLASMIEKETSLPGERARISRVFHNRLARGMKLQCDPTVQYALARAGRPAARLSTRDLEFASPWNTYHVRGLPPGPIASAGAASLAAAVDPADGHDLYFVAAPDGGHRFSTSLEGHLEAVAEWRRYLRSSK
jgi:UPF0755 protein